MFFNVQFLKKVCLQHQVNAKYCYTVYTIYLIVQ